MHEDKLIVIFFFLAGINGNKIQGKLSENDVSRLQLLTLNALSDDGVKDVIGN